MPTQDNPTMITVFEVSRSDLRFVSAALAQQVTVDLAKMLSSFSGVVARPLQLLSAEEPPLDQNLDLTRERDPRLSGRADFILHSALPINSALRSLTLSHGGSLALTGRLGMDSQGLALAFNLWEVSGRTLWACHSAAARREELPRCLSELAGALAYKMGSAQNLEEATQRAASELGTMSMDAFESFAAATFHLKRIEKMAHQSQVSAARALANCLKIDPLYRAPRLLLTEHAMSRIGAGDTSFARTILETVSELKGDHIIFGLLRFEASLLLGETQRASEILHTLSQSHPGAAQLERAAQRLLERGVTPRAAQSP